MDSGETRHHRCSWSPRESEVEEEEEEEEEEEVDYYDSIDECVHSLIVFSRDEQRRSTTPMLLSYNHVTHVLQIGDGAGFSVTLDRDGPVLSVSDGGGDGSGTLRSGRTWNMKMVTGETYVFVAPSRYKRNEWVDTLSNRLYRLLSLDQRRLVRELYDCEANYCARVQELFAADRNNTSLLFIEQLHSHHLLPAIEEWHRSPNLSAAASHFFDTFRCLLADMFHGVYAEFIHSHPRRLDSTTATATEHAYGQWPLVLQLIYYHDWIERYSTSVESEERTLRAASSLLIRLNGGGHELRAMGELMAIGSREIMSFPTARLLKRRPFRGVVFSGTYRCGAAEMEREETVVCRVVVLPDFEFIVAARREGLDEAYALQPYRYQSTLRGREAIFHETRGQEFLLLSLLINERDNNSTVSNQTLVIYPCEGEWADSLVDLYAALYTSNPWSVVDTVAPSLPLPLGTSGERMYIFPSIGGVVGVEKNDHLYLTDHNVAMTFDRERFYLLCGRAIGGGGGGGGSENDEGDNSSVALARLFIDACRRYYFKSNERVSLRRNELWPLLDGNGAEKKHISNMSLELERLYLDWERATLHSTEMVMRAQTQLPYSILRDAPAYVYRLNLYCDVNATGALTKQMAWVWVGDDVQRHPGLNRSILYAMLYRVHGDEVVWQGVEPPYFLAQFDALTPTTYKKTRA